MVRIVVLKLWNLNTVHANEGLVFMV